MAIAAGAGPGGVRARRPSILDAPVAPSELLAAQGEGVILGGGPPGARTRARTNSSAAPTASVNGNVPPAQDPTEMQNARALEVLDRVSQKLTGRDFKPNEELDVLSQVNKLIAEATKLENLCQHYIGWCSFW
jgi:serine/threonine-protein kinase mTOR